MSVALATMDSAYGLSRLGMSSHHHHHLHHPYHRRPCSPVSHVASRERLQERREEQQQQQQREPSDSSSPLRFSVVNILRPEFGREAILNTRSSPKTTPIKVTPLPVHSPLGLQPRDLSLSSSRLSAHSPPVGSSFSGAQRETGREGDFSPVQRHSSNLSRSGSLESLASNRSSVTGGSVNGAASVSSAASCAGAESVSGESNASSSASQNSANGQSLWPAWIYCTRYSDRPSSGPRSRRVKRNKSEKVVAPLATPEEKRPRTAFSAEQLAKLKREFEENRYLTEVRRQKLSKQLGLNEQQIKIWFQNKRAKIKKASGQKNPLAIQLMAQGLYNHSTVPVDEDGEEILLKQE